MPQAVSFFSILTLAKPKPKICENCWQSFQFISEKHCPNCYKEGEEDICSDCQEWQKQGHAICHQAIFSYNAAMKDFFSRYKFQGDYLLRYTFQDILVNKLKTFKGYTIVPIPLSHERLKSRGFNQVTGFLETSRLPYQNLLTKKDIKAQSSKTRAERLASQQEYDLLDGVQLPEKILLFDDIYTTGSTLEQAKNFLLKKGVKKIITFSLAR